MNARSTWMVSRRYCDSGPTSAWLVARNSPPITMSRGPRPAELDRDRQAVGDHRQAVPAVKETRTASTVLPLSR